jgi:hypothetical protein
VLHMAAALLHACRPRPTAGAPTAAAAAQVTVVTRTMAPSKGSSWPTGGQPCPCCPSRTAHICSMQRGNTKSGNGLQPTAWHARTELHIAAICHLLARISPPIHTPGSTQHPHTPILLFTTGGVPAHSSQWCWCQLLCAPALSHTPDPATTQVVRPFTGVLQPTNT